MTPARQKILDEIIKVMEDRSATHGDALTNFDNLAEVWTWWLEKRGLIKGSNWLTPEDAAVMCTLAKIARKLSPSGLSNTENWIDGAGYEICGAEIAESRKANDEGKKA